MDVGPKYGQKLSQYLAFGKRLYSDFSRLPYP